MNTTVRTPHLLITGATGYIGRELIAMALREQWRVTALARRRPAWLADLPVQYFIYDLTRPVKQELLAGATVMIHLAGVTRDERLVGDVPEDVEVEVTLSLLDVAAQHGVHFVFVSSQSAALDAPSRYGRVKWRIEQAVEAKGETTLRLGLVYGGAENEGLFGRLCGLVDRLPVLPGIIPAPQVQPVYVVDVCRALLLLAGGDHPKGVYNLAEPIGMPFTRFLKVLANERVRKLRLFLPVPLFILKATATLVRRIPGVAKLGLDRLTALAALRPMQTVDTIKALGLKLTPIEDGMHPTGSARRRRLAHEGRWLLNYVLDDRAGPGLVRRYIRAVETVGNAAPLGLPRRVQRSSCLLRVWEALPSSGRRGSTSSSGDNLEQRLRLAVATAEAHPAGAARFMLLERVSRGGAVVRLAWTVIGDIGFYLARLGFVLQSTVAKAFK